MLVKGDSRFSEGFILERDCNLSSVPPLDARLEEGPQYGTACFGQLVAEAADVFAEAIAAQVLKEDAVLLGGLVCGAVKTTKSFNVILIESPDHHCKRLLHVSFSVSVEGTTLPSTSSLMDKH